MSDLLTRLKERAGFSPYWLARMAVERGEAAAEIERLRAELQAVINNAWKRDWGYELSDSAFKRAVDALQQKDDDHARSCDLLNGGLKCSCKP